MTPTDEPTSVVITGRLGARVKELICAATAWSIMHPTLMVPSRRRHLVPERRANMAIIQ
ncbi:MULTISPECIES: hypothetical protein [unclassified Nocardia]|uniref:hypothetical protein n=1 Tax=unclassified Nocardia TaxID=2637762 RepID=UPI001CE49BD4|nr:MULTISPECIES: hypothetical protein [unclassified Nocardia]